MTIVKRIPQCTYVKAEGALGRWGEFASTTLDDVWGRLERFHQDRQGINSDELDVLAERIVTQQTTQTAGRVVQLADPVLLPWQAYEPGDTLTLNLAPKDVKGDKRVAAIVVSKGPQDAVPKYDVHFGSPVYSNDTAIASGLRTLIREFKRPVYSNPTPMVATLPDVPPTDPSVTGGLEDASWVFAAADSSVHDRTRADRILSGAADQVTILADIVALHGSLVGGGTIGFMPGTYYFSDELTNCDTSGNNINDLFKYPLRFRGSAGVVFKFTSNPASSKFFIRAGDTTGSGHKYFTVDGIRFDAAGFSNVDGVLIQQSVGLIPKAYFNGCTFSSFAGDWIFNGERNYALQVIAGTFLSCTPTASFFHIGGFSVGLVYIAGNNFSSCTGILWTGAGFTTGGIITGNNFSSGMTIPTPDGWIHVFHNRIAGVLVTGEHAGAVGTVQNTLADAKGDLIAGTAADTFARLAVGANKLALHAASAETTGLKWQLPGGRSSLPGFHRENLAASLTASQLERSLSATLDAALPVVVTHPGSITGISVASTEARTASTATFEVYKNGVATGLTCVLDGTNTTFAFGVQAIDLDTFAAGDRLDVRVTTTGTWTPTTADVEAVIVVQYDPA